MDLFIAHASLLVPLLIGLGLLSGFLAGLLGIGGGIVLVPGLFFIFKTLGYAPDILMHLSIGTSLAVIMSAGISSALAHHKKGAVRKDMILRIGPGIVAGVLIGTVIAAMISGGSLALIFASALCVVALLMQISPRAKAGNGPSFVVGTAGGAGIGILSSLMGIGGATLNVPFMTLQGVPIHQAVASSSAMGVLIAVPGTLGFMAIGWNAPDLPPFTAGYINLAAFICISPLAALAAPLGAHVAHQVSVVMLRRIFAVFLVIVAIRMMMEAL